MRLRQAPDLRHDRAGLRLPGERLARRLVFRPTPPALFTLRHEEFTLLELCRDVMSTEALVAAALRDGVTDSREFAGEVIDTLLECGLLQPATGDP